jgi:hypothetical protein
LIGSEAQPQPAEPAPRHQIRNQVDELNTRVRVELPSPEVQHNAFTDERDWSLIGPTRSDAYTIVCGTKQIGVVIAADVGARECACNAKLIIRSPARHFILEHILAELEGDDEGTRWADIIGMIRAELDRTREPGSP